ncbi:unnamed protein product [Linum tenue]|uniref:GDSL esterase/lipase n=1 Tax=Linum tenue TaxID=586396 RepID=A0AAV0PFA0_9ROSI|nr:unnamed protein product [Linum tenue]
MAVADPLVPSLTIFGDSVSDVGNNNNLITLIRANFPPYGRDFAEHRPTGRFSNGKLAIDLTGKEGIRFNFWFLHSSISSWFDSGLMKVLLVSFVS